MVPIGNCLVWYDQVRRCVFRDDAGNDLARDALQARMEDHINTITGRYQDHNKGWDVINEALNDFRLN